MDVEELSCLLVYLKILKILFTSTFYWYHFYLMQSSPNASCVIPTLPHPYEHVFRADKVIHKIHLNEK